MLVPVRKVVFNAFKIRHQDNVSLRIDYLVGNGYRDVYFPVRAEIMLADFHPWLGPIIGFKQIDVFAAGSCGQHHSFAYPKLHFSRCKVSYHDCKFSDEILWFVSGLDSGEDVSRGLVSETQRELQ